MIDRPAMHHLSQDVTDAELTIVKAIWSQGRSTIRKVAETLYPQGTKVQHATIQKLVERLERKHIIQRDRSTWPHQFDAIVSRDELLTRRLHTLAEQLTNGDMSPVMTSLIRSFRPAEKDRRMLRELLDDLDAHPSGAT